MLHVSHQKKKKVNRTPSSNASSKKVYRLRDVARIPIQFFCDPDYFWHLVAIFLIGEFIFCTLIIKRVAYTEIDWVAYMQEVEGFIQGERDYTKLKGDTGPLVYPAGFVYIYSALYYITDKGKNIRFAQYIFEGLYLISQFIVCCIYRQSKKVPPYLIFLLGCSKRFHSIFLLRCFNDPVAMIFMFGCILAMTHRRFVLGTILYSIGLSIKMNVLLFFPAFGIILWQVLGAFETIGHLSLMALIQLGLAYPFLNEYPIEYLSKAFEFTRVFDYTWTVNWRMMSEETFLSSWFSQQLLVGHALTLFMVITFNWCETKGGLMHVFKSGFTHHRLKVSNDEIITMMFTSNFIGILFARSLHYQFYSWYFQTIPFLLWLSQWQTNERMFKTTIKIIVFVTIETCWLTYPSTERSSWTLATCHILMLVGLYGNYPGPDYKVPSIILKDKLN